MKKVIITVLLSFSFIIFPFTGNGSAAEISVGASTWYCWWEQPDAEHSMNLKPTLLFGPVLSARFDESWSLAGVFLYGKFSSKDKDSQNGGPPNGISRFDSDLSLNYNINRYFKIFGGSKFMGFFWDENGSNGTHWSVGPGLGLGSTLPLTSSLYLLFNVSGTYSWGKHEDTGGGSNTKTTINIVERGFNTNLSLAYYFASASTSVNLGCRYQYLFIDYPSDSSNKDEGHYFLGPTLSVVYSF